MRLKKIVEAVCFFFFLAKSNNVHGQPSRHDLERVAYSKAWLRLLHYSVKGEKYTSRLDGKDFFFAKDGKTNPLNELVASIEGMKSNASIGRLKLKPLCAFPERSRFIGETFGIVYDKYSCPIYDSFLKKYHNPNGVSLVFSSAYPNNPASMFGHTFLKIHSDRKNDLLNMGVNFAAWTPPDMNMLVFMYKGVVGGYPGLWSMEPYYKKVNEYINSESRDLWEYRLSLTPEETKRLLAHLWELEVTSYFDYFFFDENCSYQVLKAIEAIRLDWDVTQHRIYIIPGETVKNVVGQKGAVLSVHFRPSLFHQAQIKLEALDENDQKSALRWINNVADQNQKPKVLEAALTGLLYEKAKKKKSWSKQDQLWEDKILTLSALSLENKKIEVIPSHFLQSRPDWGHDPYSIYLSGSYQVQKKSYSFVEKLKIRSAYHDLMGKDIGYAPFSEIEFPWIEVQYRNIDHKLEINEIGGFSTTSLFPMTALDQRKSWRVKISLERERIDPCKDCLRPVVEAGAGATLGELNYRLYSLFIGQIDAHPQLRLGYRLQPGVEIGGLSKIGDKIKIRVFYKGLQELGKSIYTQKWQFDQSAYLSRNSEVRFELKAISNDAAQQNFLHEVSVQYIKYFR